LDDWVSGRQLSIELDEELDIEELEVEIALEMSQGLGIKACETAQ